LKDYFPFVDKMIIGDKDINKDLKISTKFNLNLICSFVLSSKFDIQKLFHVSFNLFSFIQASLKNELLKYRQCLISRSTMYLYNAS